MNQRICKYCGCYEYDHNYELLARQCFPERIKILQKRIEELEKQARPSLPVNAVVSQHICYRLQQKEDGEWLNIANAVWDNRKQAVQAKMLWLAQHNSELRIIMETVVG